MIWQGHCPDVGKFLAQVCQCLSLDPAHQPVGVAELIDQKQLFIVSARQGVARFVHRGSKFLCRAAGTEDGRYFLSHLARINACAFAALCFPCA